VVWAPLRLRAGRAQLRWEPAVRTFCLRVGSLYPAPASPTENLPVKATALFARGRTCHGSEALPTVTGPSPKPAARRPPEPLTAVAAEGSPTCLGGHEFMGRVGKAKRGD
ncbi:hypothetical protein H1C71_036196, partial [Ictidomys tridecemlineatus]